MKRIITLLGILLAANVSAQLTVKPNTTSNTDTFIYVQDEILFVEQDVNLVKNTNDATTESSIYLRGGAQMIQGTTNSDNAGDGTLSVFQEGSTDQWDYNNWSSPVSVADVTPGGSAAAAGNGFFGSRTIYTPFEKTDSGLRTSIGGYDSVVSVGASSQAVQIPSYWFFYYPTGTDYQGWVQVGDNDGIIPAGYGFTMKGVTETDLDEADNYDNVKTNPGAAQRYDFRGRPNSGTVTISTLTAGQTTFVGNPYPSAIDLSYFLLENSSEVSSGSDLTSLGCTTDAVNRKPLITGIAYFWDSDPSVQSHFLIDYQGGYEAFAPVDCSTGGMSVGAAYKTYDNDGNPIGDVGGNADVDGMARNRRYAPIAQGFLVTALDAGDFDDSKPLSFENRHRVYIKESNPDAIFKFNGQYNSKSRNTSETEESTLEVIPKLRLNIEVNESYTRQLALGFWPTATNGVDNAMDAINRDVINTDAGFLHGDDSYIIDVRPFDESERIPLYLKVGQQADVKFTATSFENFDTENVFIYDSETDRYYNVKYTSWSTTLQEGNYNGRFFLTFEEEEVLDANEFAANNFDIFQNNSNSQLEIRNPNGLDLKAVTIYDITGKRVISERNLDAQPVFTFSTRNLQDAIYVVNITTSQDIEISKKITVSQSR